MRFPFFKTQKTESKEPINTVSSTPSAAPNKLGATQRIPVGVLSSPRLGKTVTTPTPVAAPKPAASPVAQGPMVSLKIMSLASQIPTQVFSVQGQAALPSARVNIPVHAILPQLASGKISVKLGELLAYFPPNILRSPLPPFPEQQAVVLPLEEVIPAVPHDLLSNVHESVISADDPELGKLPTLIDDASVAAQRRTRSTLSLAETQPVRRILDEQPKPEPKIEAPKPVVAVVAPVVVPPPPAPRNGQTGTITISLRGLIAALPDHVFSGSRADLQMQTNAAQLISLSTESIIPQLRTGVVKMPVAVIAALLPVTLLAKPLPNLEGLSISLPLNEIIPQLPANLFTEQLREPAQQSAETDLDIPDPFQEKKVLAQQAATAATTAAPRSQDFGLDVEALDDESFEIFTEKKSAAPVISAKATVPIERITPVPAAKVQPVEPPPASIAPPTRIALPEPVAEVKPVEPIVTPAPVIVPEPVAEIKTVEPIVAPLPVVIPEPVAEIKSVETVAPAPVAPAATDPAYADGDLAEEDETETLSVAAKTETPGEAFAGVDEKKFLIDLNRCTAEDLMAIQGIGRGLAHRIIEFRNARGSFTSVEELRQVSGIGRKTYRALAGVQARALNRLLGAPHDGELTLQEIVRYAGQLPGIQGCMLALSDGLFLTGKLPEHLDKDTISVFAPQLFKKVGRYAKELNVGSIRRFTVFTDAQPISIFKAGDVYLIIVHDAQRYSKALLRRCERISEEIARLSSQRVTV